MAEYNEVIKQFKRMCKSISPAKCTRGECPMGCENIGQCRKIAFERPSCFEDIVMAWAEDHPEPVYPTWYDWMAGNGLDPDDPIPADIAQKLGIEPKP